MRDVINFYMTMINSLNKYAQVVQDVLSQYGMEFKVVEFSASTRTAADAAGTIGCEVAQIVKSLIFCTKESRRPVLVLVSGVNRVNEKGIAAQVGEAIEKADADFTREVTGFAIGGIPPVGHKQAIETFIDEDLLRFQDLWAAAGTPNAVFKLTAASLPVITGGKVICVK